MKRYETIRKSVQISEEVIFQLNVARAELTIGWVVQTALPVVVRLAPRQF